MSQQKKKRQHPWTRKLRMIILRNDTLEKVHTLHFRWIDVVLGGLGISIFIAIATAAAISFTPLRYAVPGYAEITENRVYVNLLDRIDNLESQIDNQQLYINKLQKVLSGQHHPDEEQLVQSIRQEDPNFKMAEKIREDAELRQKVINNSDRGLALPRVVGEQNRPENLSNRSLIPPLKGLISAPFKQSDEHYGIDIIAPAYSPIKSVDRGIVIAADWTMETGYTIGIQHDDNLISYYKHNSVLLKKIGEAVEAGEAIAIIGNTGHLTTGPHLHFELWYNGRSLDPAQYVNFDG